MLFLTARDATEDKVAGLTVGRRRLRDQALQPRRARGPDPRRAAPDGPASAGERPRSRSPTSRWTTRPTRCGARASLVDLTATEFNLLRYLLENARRVLSKSEILDHVWNYDFDGDPNIVETYISYLRKKIDSFDPPLIHTIRGVGYSLRLARDRESRRVVRRRSPMSLRRRLVVGMLVLLVAGLVTTDLVTSSSLRSFLSGGSTSRSTRRRTRPTATSSPAVPARPGGRGPAPRPPTPAAVAGRAGAVAARPGTPAFDRPTPPASARRPAARTACASLAGPAEPRRLRRGAIDATGTVVFQVPSGLAASPIPRPILPAGAARPALPDRRACSAPTTAPTSPERPPSTWPRRGPTGLALPGRRPWPCPGGTLVTAIPLDPTDQTLASLTHVEVIVSIVVILALLVLALWIVRFGLRPLEDMTETAGAIAAGDLTRRIRRPDDRSEVGRLGSALNGMLSQIEAAFAERTSSESRLRRFVADASHELRTPLTSIRGYAELLRKGAFDDEDARRRAAERIEHEAARMGLLVDDLLLLARLDQGRPLERVHRRPRVAWSPTPSRRPGPPTPAGRITLDVPASVAVVVGDAARLRQVVDNLLHNAVVHTPPGTPVHVRGAPGRAARRGHAWPTRAPGSTPTRRRASSTASTGAARPARARAPGWVCRSWPPWPPPTAGGPASTSDPGRGRGVHRRAPRRRRRATRHRRPGATPARRRRCRTGTEPTGRRRRRPDDGDERPWRPPVRR